MSQPNDPGNNQSGTNPTTPANATGPQTAAPTPNSGASNPAPQRGGLVPPWQRGPAGNGGSGASGPSASPTEPLARAEDGVSSTPTGVNGSSQGGPAPRGVVSGDPKPTVQAPVTKLDAPGGTSSPTDPGRFQEVPTRTIARDPAVDAGLPDLDQIHHTDAAAAPVQARSAPAQIGSAGAGLRAAVQIRRLDPWATFKVAGVLAVVGFVIWMIAVAVLYLVLDGMGVWDQVNSGFGTLVTADGAESDVIGAGTIFLYAAVLGVVGGVLLTALATIGAYIYNLVADVVGGIEVTLADLD